MAPDGTHEVTISAAGSHAIQVEGLLDGAVKLIGELNGESAGHMTKPPTSVHRHTVCQANTCTDIIEYDYDLHAPDAEGVAEWMTPKGSAAVVDRLRFKLDAGEAFGRMALESPAALVLEAE
jgi:hypothetical protein